jgi:O-Antigen ligase
LLSTSVNARQSLILRNASVGIGVAGTVFALSYVNGGFAPTTRAYAGMAAWWLLGVGAAFGIASARAGVARFAVVAFGLFAAFAVWILISISWAPDAERAFAQFDQVALYVAVLAIAIVLARLMPAPILVGAVAVALVALAVVALVSRCFPSTFGLQSGSTILPALKNRLSFPLGYWNGLGIEVALAYPLLLSAMCSRRSRVVTALAAFPLPILASVMYLTSSRGAFAAAAVGILALLALTPRRWSTLTAVLVAGAGGAVAVAVLVPKHALVDGDVNTALGVHQGHHAALWIAITCVLTALVWAGLAEVGRRVPAPPRVMGRVVAGVLVVLVVAAIVLAHPVAKFDNFKRNPPIGNQTTNHLLNSSGSGRWQFWSAAASEFRAHPLNGGGAGSWKAWWLQHGSLKVYTEFAHSLYLEALGELGIVGLLLIGGAVLVAVGGAIRSARLLQSGDVAAAAACGSAFFVAAAYDWIWQLAGVAVVGVGMLGFALGALPSTRAATAGRLGALRPALALIAVAAIVPQYVVLSAGSHLSTSRAAVDAGDAARARSEALAAKSIEPWAAGPYLQLGLISEREGQFNSAAHWVDEAINRSPRDAILWLIAARIEGKRGRAGPAVRDLHELHRLDPNSIALDGGP